jgi:hypothetical protein
MTVTGEYLRLEAEGDDRILTWHAGQFWACRWYVLHRNETQHVIPLPLTKRSGIWFQFAFTQANCVRLRPGDSV